ncbi:hypothetical protein DL93DRAFT_1163770 [Clavulina sp. PMI_390]|nr:hypothetical protein DL93DRAFT_1163770 [Clavulina sp. PMI_390]
MSQPGAERCQIMFKHSLRLIPLPTATTNAINPPATGRFTEILPRTMEQVADFFDEGDGSNPLYRLSLSEDSQYLSKRRESTATIASVATFFPRFGAIELSLADVCSFISEGAALRGAHIISVKGYCEPAGPVLHRFVVLHLRRVQRKDIWLRLDRRRGQGVSAFRFVFASGDTQANDKVSTFQSSLALDIPVIIAEQVCCSE